MATTLTDRITKLAAKIEQYDARIAENTEQKEQAIAEIQTLLGGAATARTTTSDTKRTRNTGTLGDRIIAYLESNNGQTRDTIATKLRSTTVKVGLSIRHLQDKGLVQKTDDRFYIVGGTPAVAQRQIMADDHPTEQ